MPNDPAHVLLDVASVLKTLSALCDEPRERFPVEGIGIICRWAAERVEVVMAPMVDALV